MLATPHIVAGLVVGTLSPNPVAAFVGGIVTHFVADALPHLDARSFRDKSTREQVWISDIVIGAIDGLIAIGVMYYVWKQGASPTVMMGSIGAWFPDVIEAPFFLFYRERYRWLHHLSGFHGWVHFDKRKFNNHRAWVYAGAITQIVLLVAGYAYFRHDPTIVQAKGLPEPAPIVQEVSDGTAPTVTP